jgi:hypothetical protein
MNKKVLIIIVVILLLVAGGWYFMSGKKSVSPSTQNPTGTEAPSAATSLRNLIAKGVSQSCTFSADKSKGTIYMTGGKIRGDFEITDAELNGKTMTSHMIILDNTNYMWTEGSKTGIKMNFDASATPVPTSGTSTANSFSANTDLNYKCSAWIVDTGKFTLPTDVTFAAFAMPSQGIKAPNATGSTTSSSSQCAYCDSLTGSDKTQCLTALKCN